MALARITASRRRRALARRNPSRAVRRANSPRPPRAAALAMSKELRRRLALFEAVIERLLFPVLEEFEPGEDRTLVASAEDEPDARTRVDAKDPRDLAISTLRSRANVKPSRELLRKAAAGKASAIRQLAAHNESREFWRAALQEKLQRTARAQLAASAAQPKVAARLSAIELHLVEIFDVRSVDSALGVIGKRVATANGVEIQRVIGISIREADPGVAAFIDNWRAINVSRIKSLAGQELVEITQLLQRAEPAGLRVETLRKQIEDRFGVTRSKADLLARDQTLTLNAQITRQRQTNVGIESYVWTTSGDDRVRETHADLDGQTFRWDNPPDVGDGRRLHPGEDYQCRCTAFPVLPELA